MDADQIIRADMAELYDMDIDGKPLAYTPFCDNNKEMDGFRFWNQVIACSAEMSSSLCHVVAEYQLRVTFPFSEDRHRCLALNPMTFKIQRSHHMPI